VDAADSALYRAKAAGRNRVDLGFLQAAEAPLASLTHGLGAHLVVEE
jgi:hypothetical protein